MSIKPPALRKGDRIGIMSPSSYIDRKALSAGIALLEDRGFDVYVHPQTFSRRKSSAGTEAAKTDALQDLFSDKSIRAVFAAGGGNHGLFTLPETDFALIRRNPKIIMGFSDTTALLNAFNARSNLTTFHGPVVTWLPKIGNVNHVFDMLAGKAITYPVGGATVLRTGTARGPLIGGNLTLMNYLSGTEYMPATRGAILFLEDINEEFSNIDRMFWKLRATHALDHIAGLVIGQMTDCKDTGSRAYGHTVRDIVERNTRGLDIPILMKAPFGHTSRFYAMPVGGLAALTAKGKTASLVLAEPAVKP